MKNTESDKQRLLEILKRGGTWSTIELSKSLNVEKKQISELVRQLRRSFLENGEVDVYVYTTKGGYSIDEKPENVIYEAHLRMALGVGILLNGVYVFKRGNNIAHKQFINMNIAYKPKLIELQHIIK